MGGQATRRTIAVATAAWCLAGCQTRVVDLGGPGTPPCSDDAGPPASCAAPASYDGGAGYYAGTPVECADSTSTPLALGSTDAVTAALLGAWTGCAQGGPYVGATATGVQFTIDASGARFALLGLDAAWNLLPNGGSAYQGSFVVVDSSSTLGPGTYQVRFTADNGGVFLSQVAVLGSPTKLRFFAPGANDFAPARTWQFRATVCGPQFDTTDVCGSRDDLLSRMVGRWIWCSGTLGGPFGIPDPANLPGMPYVGIDIRPDATWSMLTEDVDGGLIAAPVTRSATESALTSGSVQFESNQTLWISGGATVVAPGSPRVDACGRVFMPSPVYACARCESATPSGCGETCPLSVSKSGEMVRAR